MSSGSKIRILSDSDLEELYSLPALNDEERKSLFELEESDRAILDKMASFPAKIDFLLQKGYFYAKQYFFNFTFQQARQDTWFIINNYFPHEPFPKKRLSKHFHYANQKIILEQFGYRQITTHDQIKLRQYAKDLTRRHIYPKFILDELLEFCQRNNLVRPAYSTMQSIVSNALQEERNRLLTKVSSLFDKRARAGLDNLLECKDNFYRLTLLKKSAKDFSTNEILKEINKQQYLLEIYEHASAILPKLNISVKNIEYYAGMATYYPISKLKQMKRNLARLYLLCYVRYRLLEVNDNLITSFIYRGNKYYQEAEEYANEQANIKDGQAEQRLLNAGKLAQIYANRNIADHELRPTAFQIVPEDEMDQFAKELTQYEEKKARLIWQYLGKQSRCIKLNLRPLFRAIKFSYGDNTPIKEALDFFHRHLNSNKSFSDHPFEKLPIKFIPEALLPQIIDKSIDPIDGRRRVRTVNGDRYEYVLYLQLRKMVNSGQAFVKDSINYRHLEDELIPYEYWVANKDKILAAINLPLLLMPINEILKLLNEELSARYHETNRRIDNGENEHIKLQKNKQDIITWRLPYKKQDDEVNNPFYENLPNINIGDLIRYVVQETKLDTKFTKIQQRYTKNRFDLNQFVAAMVAGGTGIGIQTMSEISDIGFQELNTMFKTCFRTDTLRDANDEVVNQIAKLPVFKFYTLAEYGIHASVDGQKVETRSHTIKARYSKKYFGLGKGLSSYKLVANHVPANDRIIGTNDHESHYVLDITKSNTSEIEVAAISGDMHSINCVNFALMHLFGYRFMPRFTSLPKKAQSLLVSFQEPEEFSDYLIKPSSKINEALIIREWDNVLRILASLAMKETSQAIIVKKLSSYKRANPTLQALIEFDQIVMSSYMLKYIDDAEIRSNVHRSLNRGESLHQLITAIRKVSDNKLPGSNDPELSAYNECNRLIANCIIYYNAKLLSNLYLAYEEQGDAENCELIKRLSPVAWQHINLMGKYEFCYNQKVVDLQAVTKMLLANPKINFMAES
jgi:TnpA family transposase